MMGPALTLPRLVFGAGAIAALAGELAMLGSNRPLLVSDRGLENAGTVAALQAAMPGFAAVFLDIPENPTAAGADGALALYREAACDAVVALGGGSVLDTGKIVAALAASTLDDARELIGKPHLIGNAVIPLVAIPTTIGTGSDSSPVCGIHLEAGGPAIGTRHPALVPKVAVCDPNLARTLPRRLIAATGIDALSHCVEGFFAEPANPIIDALALDGARRVFADLRAALEPEGDTARASLMAAAFAGGAAIHKGLGPAHAMALVCGDQDVHHGTLIGVVLPEVTRLVARHVPAKATRMVEAIGLPTGTDLADALEGLVASLDLPVTLTAAGYRPDAIETRPAAMVASHFNRTAAYVPSETEYRGMLHAILA